jgi:hypothetical protein
LCATPNPVRAEQPEVQGANSSPLVVTRGDGVPLPDQAAALAEFKRQCLRAPAAPGAAVGVDEAMARRLDDYLGDEFDIRIGKQAAHAALTAALAGKAATP